MIGEAQIQTLCLPLIATDVPAQFNLPSELDNEYARLFTERAKHGLPTVYPDSSIHKDPREAFVQTTNLLGFKSSKYADKIFKAYVDPMVDGLISDECAVSFCYVMYVQDQCVDIVELIQSLEKHHKGLGETVSWWIQSAIGSNRIPGIFHASSIYDEYCETKYEGLTEDADIREMFVQYKYEPEHIEAILPSAIRAKLGGNIMLKPRKVLKTTCQIQDALKSIGYEDAESLGSLISVDLKTAAKAAEKALARIVHEVGYHALHTAERRPTLVFAPENCTEITEYLDESRRDYGESMRCIDALIVQRVYSPETPKMKPIDGLDVVCKVSHVYQLLEEIIVRLQDGRQIK